MVYKKLYCSVCNSLKDNFGAMNCMLTSYDATFFLAIFDGLEIERKSYKISCPVNPFYKKLNIELSERARNYTALISAYYMYAKLKDDIEDENKLRYKFIFNRFKKNKKMQKKFSENEDLITILQNKINEYYNLEKNASKYDFDTLSNKMGELFGEVFKNYLLPEVKKSTVNAMYKLGFYVGKWTYLADAFDDLEKDKANNKFNPIFYMEDYPDMEIILKKVMFMSDYLTNRMLLELGNLELNRNLEIAYNIIHYGMPLTMVNIANNKYKIKKERK